MNLYESQRGMGFIEYRGCCGRNVILTDAQTDTDSPYVRIYEKFNGSYRYCSEYTRKNIYDIVSFSKGPPTPKCIECLSGLCEKLFTEIV